MPVASTTTRRPCASSPRSSAATRDFDGLNLTWETLEGLVKHNGPVITRDGTPVGRYREHGVPQAILDYGRAQDLELWSFASAEAQVAALADDIAYNTHDIDDGLRADLFALDELAEVAFLRELLLAVIREGGAAIEPARTGHELVRRVITRLIEDVIGETRARLERLAPSSVDDVRATPSAVGAFSTVMAEADSAIKGFLYSRMYRQHRVVRIMGEAETVLSDLFGRYAEHPGDLPADWSHGVEASDDSGQLRRIGDFIAGMTDRYALGEHARLFPNTPELR